MNQTTKTLIVVLAFPVAATLSLVETSCKYYDAAKTALEYKTTPQTADQIIVDAEKTTKIADDTFNTFLKLDYENRTFIKERAPSVHAFAEYLRKDDRALNWLRQARSATKAFKTNRTSDNQANLQTLIATIKQAVNDTNSNIATANAVTP